MQLLRDTISCTERMIEKVTLVCGVNNWSWRIYASRHKADNIFGIRKYNLIHMCGDDNLCSRGHPRADAT